PEIRRSSVVLPEPLRPTRPTASPGSTASETSRSACTSRALLRPRATNTSFSVRCAFGYTRNVRETRSTTMRPGVIPGASSGAGGKRVAHDVPERLHETRVVVRHLDAVELHAQLARLVLRLVVDVPPDLQMIRHEPDRTDEDVVDAAAVQRLEVVEDVRPQPGLARGRF